MNLDEKKNKRLIPIILIILVVFCFGFTVFSIKFDRKITFFESTIKDGISYVINIVSSPFQYIDDKWDAFINADKIYEEYLVLKENYASSIIQESKVQSLEDENAKLKELLELKSSMLEYEKINATVIYRGANSWLDSFVIDKGSDDGIDNDMAVIVNGGLIGYTDTVSKNTSTVKLLTNSNMINKVSVRIDVKNKKYSYGLLYSYDEDNGLYIIEGISDYYDIPINATVTTTGLTEKFPGGIVLGTVKSVNTDNYDLKKVVMVTPAIDLNDITYVTVLKREAISE